MDTARSMTNPQVAELLDCNFTHASRLRSGQREPSIRMMGKIRDIFDWPIDDQVSAIMSGNYYIVLEKHIDQYAKEHPQ